MPKRKPAEKPSPGPDRTPPDLERMQRDMHAVVGTAAYLKKYGGQIVAVSQGLIVGSGATIEEAEAAVGRNAGSSTLTFVLMPVVAFVPTFPESLP